MASGHTHTWIGTLHWSDPLLVEVVSADRSLIPDVPGVYLFSTRNTPVCADLGILYVGKAKRLRRRLSGYLKSPFDILLLSPRKKDRSLSHSLRHTGKNLLLMKIQQQMRNAPSGPSGVWVRWCVCEEPEIMEGRLIAALEPAFNTSLNPRLK